MTWKVPERPVGSVLGEPELLALRRVLESGASLSWGEEVPAFEREFATLTGAKHAVATGSCTVALKLAAQVLRLGPGDEVICTPQTFWGTIVELVARGVTLRFADTASDHLNIDPATVESLVNERTRAIYVVHHGGLPVDLDELQTLASRHDLVLVEDAAHAVGARYRERPIGGGSICCFSFSSSKNITTLGEGGMFCTDRQDWADEVRRLAEWSTVGEVRKRDPVLNHWKQPSWYDHDFESWTLDSVRTEEYGGNFRLGEAAAAVGRVQLGRLAELNGRRRQIAEQYDSVVARLDGLRAVQIPADRLSSRHLYSVFVEAGAGFDRDRLAAVLQRDHGIEINLRYFPLHLNRTMRERGHRAGECPVVERVFFEQQVDLPISGAMSDPEVETVIAALEAAVETCRR